MRRNGLLSDRPILEPAFEMVCDDLVERRPLRLASLGPLWLGVYPGLTDAHIDHVIATIRNFVQKEDGPQPVMPPVHARFCGPSRILACHYQLH